MEIKFAKYMHTLMGLPAKFDGERMVTTDRISISEMADSIQQVKKEARISLRYYQELGGTEGTEDKHYSYVLINAK